MSCALLSKRHYTDAQGRTDAPAALSVDILASICDLLESPPFTKRTVLLKHEKNQSILALSRVCKPWYRRITSCKSVFRDIAFDVSSEESIVTAGVFLKILERTTVPINVHASLGQSRDPDPMLMRLFTQLRPHAPYIVHFEYDGDMARYRGYLDLPAPNLLFFSDSFDTYPGNGPPLFCGQTPRLRVLTTLSLASQIVWATSTLSELTILNLGFLDIEPCIPLGSFLNLLRGSPRLESVNVARFTPVINRNEDIRNVSLPRLHTLNLVHNEFHAIVKHLRIPNVRKLYFCGESHPSQHVGVSPTFEAQHLFAGLPILPIFERPIEHILLKTTGNGTACADFHLHLVADGGFVLRVLLFWVLDAVPLFDDYVKRSIAGLIRTMTLAPQAHVELSHEYLISSDVPIYQPFLLAAGIDQLVIQGGFAMDVLSKLTVRAGSQYLLPRLRFLTIADWFPSSDEKTRKVLSSCLRSRVAGDVCFSVRLINTGAPCKDFDEREYIIEREF